jgi:hypothetical protein
MMADPLGILRDTALHEKRRAPPPRRPSGQVGRCQPVSERIDVSMSASPMPL